MEFKIDKRYITLQTLKAIVGYAIAVLIVLYFFNLDDPEGFVGTSLLAGVTIYLLFILPRKIIFENGVISFTEKNGMARINIRIADIGYVETSYRRYNAVTIQTRSGEKYKLHPKDAEALRNILLFGKPDCPINEINNSNKKQNMENMEIQNYDYIHIFNHDDGSIALYFDIENDKILEIGDEMNEMVEDAYMNGYNWDAFLHFYFAENAPDILEGMNTDSEAGTYVAYYEKGNAENEEKAIRFAEIIISLIENKQELFRFLHERGDCIEWD